MVATPPIITLTTDFGHLDPYVGIMKGVILGIAPQATIVDLCHQIPPFDTEAAAFCVAQSVAYFPPGSIHLIVVDPGVGTERRALIAQGRHACYVAPDNGVLKSLLAADGHIQVFEVPAPQGGTFHGRDLFAPMAARLANGVSPGELGQPLPEFQAKAFTTPRRTADGWLGQIIHIDRFGNLITNLTRNHANQIHGVKIGDVTLPKAACYGDVAPGAMAVLLGSADRLEVFVREDSAQKRLAAKPGDAVLGLVD